MGEIQHPFYTGDRVDVLFRNHGPKRCGVEVELETPTEFWWASTGPSSIARRRPPRHACQELARPYDVGLLQIDKELVLAPG